MASFIDTVNALNPVFFGVGTELSGPTITDISGNGNDGTYDPTATFGHPSPIETDPSIFSVGGVVGSVPATAGSDTDLLGNQTWIVWAYYDSTATTAHALGRRQQFGQSNGVLSGFNGGTITSHITIDDGSPLGLFRPLADPVAPVSGNFYMISTVRNGIVGSLYTNERLADTRSDLTTGAVHLLGSVGLPWWIGRGENSAAFPGLRTVMVALFNYALSQAQIISVHESALNSLSLAGYSNVIGSAILYSDSEPDPISFPFRHNWSDPLVERLSFKTGVSTAAKGYEQANGQRIKPRRDIEISQMLKDDHERRMLRAKLNAHQNRKWFIPILEDRERLTSPLLSGVQVIPTDTLYKDYEIGGYVGLRQLDNAGRVTTWEEALISGLEVDEVQTAIPTVNAYTSPEVYPVRRAIVGAQQSLRGHTDSVEDATIVARLIAEDEKTVPHRIAPWTPTLTYKSHEVFDPATWQSNDWSELRNYEVSRVLEDVDFELGAFSVEADSLAANESFSCRMSLEGKDKHAALLGWFYARGGSLNYLWVPTMQRDFATVSALSANLTVEGHNYFENFAGSEFRRDLAFVYNDNTIQFRRIDAVSLSGANEVLALSTGVPTLTNLRSVSYLLFCRLDSDTLEVARITDTKARFAWRFKEMLSSPA